MQLTLIKQLKFFLCKSLLLMIVLEIFILILMTELILSIQHVVTVQKRTITCLHVGLSPYDCTRYCSWDMFTYAIKVLMYQSGIPCRGSN